jgi:ABC-type antimicrobial peptide transport system permease subunit
VNFIFRYQRQLLLFMAAVNILTAIFCFAAPAFFFTQFFVRQPEPELTFPFVPMYHQIFWGFVFIMGIGYFVTATNPAANRGVLLIGGLGKLLAAAFWIMLYAQGEGRWLMLGGGIADALLGVVLLLMLRPSSGSVAMHRDITGCY